MNTENPGNGIVTLPSSHAVGETLDRLERLATGRGLKIFARVRFDQDAAAVGLTQLASELLLLGNPKAGTPLMQSVPAAGLDLPLKALVWEDAAGHTQIAYNDPQYIIRRHGLDAALAANLAAVVPLIERAARD